MSWVKEWGCVEKIVDVPPLYEISERNKSGNRTVWWEYR
jgi:hypothetical protein